MDALSWGAATLEKAFLDAFVNLFTGGTTPFAVLAASAPLECCLSPRSLLGSRRQQFVSWEGRDPVTLWPEAVVLI